jgi:methionyl-tRNA formyltransferase
MRLIYLGTPAFAVPTLDAIAQAGHEVIGVFTQPDRPRGRGHKDTMPPVKEAALRLGLNVFQPERIRTAENVELLRSLAPDVMVAVGYGQILPQSILDIPTQGIINVHASLLPKFRGAAPIQWAIARGESVTGVTTMKIDAGLDTGDMLLKWETPIGETENAIELGNRLAVAGAELLVRTLDQPVRPVPQDPALATYAPILKRQDGKADWTLSAREILNRIRGFQPWPGYYGFLRGQRFHVWKARTGTEKLSPGSLQVQGRALFAGCSGGSIELLEVQLEGKKRMPASAFLNGFTLSENEVME